MTVVMSAADIASVAKILTEPAPSIDSIEAKGQKTLQGWFNFPLDWWTHVILTGVVPFLILIPYVGQLGLAIPYMWGLNGINILASTSGKDSAWAMAKAAFYWGCKLLSDYLDVECGDKWWQPALRSVLLYANPWFVFDIIQVWNPHFSKEGYKIPFFGKHVNSKLAPGATSRPSSEKDFGWKYVDANNKPILGADGVQRVSYGWMGPVSIGAAITLIIPSLYSILGAFPASVTAGYTSVLNSIMLVLGGIAAVGGGGLGAMVVLPALKDKIVSYMTPAPAVPRVGTQAPPVQAAGGNANLFPSVESVAKSLLKKSQSGGAQHDLTSDYLFLGILGTVVAGGLTLAALRLKLSSGSLVE
jgi:hypothetical protein